MTKLYILQEIIRTTKANGGTPLRKLQFESRTGIRRYDWFGVYWARWSDAIREAAYLQDLTELTNPQLSKPLRYDRVRSTPIVRLA
jgi:hypothetical protein